MFLENKVCVIVGAGSLRGIGYATAELFAEHGAKIVAVDAVMNDGLASEIKASIDAASKGGVISLTRTIAREFRPMGIRANVVCPSMTETGMLDGLSEEKQKEIATTIPLQRAGRPVEIAGACLFLASDLAGYVTGATIDVNGGSHIH